jgi:hypothetical protein
MSNSIILAGDYRKIQSKSLAAANAPYPGYLLEENSAGTLQLHSSSGGAAERLIAMEDSLQGKTIADVYTAETLVNAIMPMPGSETQVMLVVGQTIVIGDKLMSAGTGKFTKFVATNVPLCVATEALDLSDSGDVDTLIAVRWL